MSARLIAEDVLDAGGKGAGRGRPSALLVMTPPNGIVVGIDLGHAHVLIAVASTEGRVLAEQRIGIDVDDESGAALDVAAGATHRLLSQLSLSITDVRSVVAGIPAPLDARTKQIRSTTIMSSWATLNPEHELGRRLGREVVAVNDADLGTEGELRFGAAKGFRDVVYVRVGDGVGAGFVLNGAAYRGAQGLAGELGHIRVVDQGDWCRCGNRGCLETVVSSSLVRARLRQVGVDVDFPFAACADDPIVARFVAEMGRTLGRVLADVCSCLNPAVIVLGGELGTAGRPLVDGVRDALHLYAQPATAAGVEVRTAQLGLRAELMGAVAHACHRALYLA